MVGVRFNTDAAEALLKSLGGLNVTGLVFMQGDRVENFVSQGISLPLVDRIYTNRKLDRTRVSVFSLGDGRKRYRFPYLLSRDSVDMLLSISLYSLLYGEMIPVP